MVYMRLLDKGKAYFLTMPFQNRPAPYLKFQTHALDMLYDVGIADTAKNGQVNIRTVFVIPFGA